MRLFGQDCGCANRKEIMFDSASLGVAEAITVAVAVSLLILAWKVK